LVFTAFSGSHQDAINKGVHAMQERKNEYWQVPYLPIDPADIGREYEPIVRINSQSGKGGVAFIMDTYFGFKLPKAMHKEFANVIQVLSETKGEISPEEIMARFKEEYLDKKEPLHFRRLHITDLSEEEKTFDTKVRVLYTDHGEEKIVEAVGNGPIDAVKRGLQETLELDVKILDYEEHALQSGSNSQAAAYIHLLDSNTGRVTYGVGVSSNITRASVRAIFSALNRLGLGEK
ncbi:MAG: alpha-isopropylmalate synthase regulatory domain-containing protein, partial [Lachnospiraceae bacterium]